MTLSRLKTYRPERLTEPSASEAAVALILSPRNKDLEVLLIKRAEHPKDPWSGQIGLPGGHREKPDKNLLATAIRETQEETGILLKSEALIGELDDTLPKGPMLPKVVIRPFVFQVNERPEPSPSDEVDHAFWAPLKSLKRVTAEVDIKGKTREVPAYRFQTYVIWGATHRILTQLLDLI